jgi:tRNA pseudouridine55 synthase
MDGFIALYKPPGLSSQQAVSRVRRLLNIKKAGHTGTLDPAAEGLLLIGLNKATRLNEYLLSSAKEYRAVVRFGLATDSGDRDGIVIQRQNSFILASQQIEEALAKFRGTIQQTPPTTSAIKIQGRRAYELHRSGQEFAMPSREVTIYQLERLSSLRTIDPANPRMAIRVLCSKGTYIRSLAIDLGKTLGCPAFLEALVRTKVGGVALSQARRLADLPHNPGILPLEEAVKELPWVDLAQVQQKEDFLHGRAQALVMVDTALVAVFSLGILLGIGRIEGGILRPNKVFG